MDDTPLQNTDHHKTRMPNFRRRLLPRSLFGRTLLIIVLPTLITLAAATYVFFDRHWYTVTNRLSYSVAGDMAMVVELMRKSTDPESVAGIVRLASEKMDLFVSFGAAESLPEKSVETMSPVRNILRHALNERISYPFDIDMRYGQQMIAVKIGAPEGVYTILAPIRRVYTPTTQVFIIWMISSSILLSAIALLFMRNQIRPVRRLADAAEAIGRSQDVPWFKLEGAAEVRQAGAALMVMRDRLKRQITQRTAMLAGVSHDLRTPITRMRLQLEMMPKTKDTGELIADIADMENMLEAYLAFARGEEAESAVEVDLSALMCEVVLAVRKQNPYIKLHAPDGTMVVLRRNAIKRCFANLVGNAARYGKHAEINIVKGADAIDIVIDDDGPGVAETQREEVFRPFTRLEKSRNPGTGGVGLGLTIARDIARFHGGDVVLENSPLGGLRARVWLPV
jgi:two-component system osmolarity sensor histidine kinase EnvZ